MNDLLIKCHYENMDLPKKGHDSDIGIDLTAMEVSEKQPNLFMVDTGISVKPPSGYYIEVVPRSSMSKTDFILGNSVGIIDPDYRGKIFCAFRYVGTESSYTAKNKAKELLGCRVAQMILRRSEQCNIIAVDKLDETDRDTGGFGSTGGTSKKQKTYKCQDCNKDFDYNNHKFVRTDVSDDVLYVLCSDCYAELYCI